MRCTGRTRYRYDFGSELKEVYDRLTQTPAAAALHATPPDCRRVGGGRREGGNLLDGRRAFFVGATAILPFPPSTSSLLAAAVAAVLPALRPKLIIIRVMYATRSSFLDVSNAFSYFEAKFQERDDESRSISSRPRIPTVWVGCKHVKRKRRDGQRAGRGARRGGIYTYKPAHTMPAP